MNISFFSILSAVLLCIATTQSCTPNATTTESHYLQTTEVKLASPIVEYGPLLFTDSSKVTASLNMEGVHFHYTTDGTDPTSESPRFENEIYIDKPCVFKLTAIHPDWLPSDPTTLQFASLGFPIQHATITPEAHESYPGKGARTLIDQQKGSANFRDGNWIGFQQADMEATLDLGEIQEVKEVIASIYHDPGSWIFAPKSISIYGGKNLNSLSMLGETALTPPQEEENAGMRFIPVVFNPQKVRYIQLKAENQGVLPEWHGGYPDGKPWLFLDEIIIK